MHSRHYTVRFPYVWPKSKMIWISSARHRHKFSTKNELRYVHHHIIQLAVGMTAPQHIYIYLQTSFSSTAAKKTWPQGKHADIRTWKALFGTRRPAKNTLGTTSFFGLGESSTPKTFWEQLKLFTCHGGSSFLYGLLLPICLKDGPLVSALWKLLQGHHPCPLLPQKKQASRTAHCARETVASLPATSHTWRSQVDQDHQWEAVLQCKLLNVYHKTGGTHYCLVRTHMGRKKNRLSQESFAAGFRCSMQGLPGLFPDTSGRTSPASGQAWQLRRRCGWSTAIVNSVDDLPAVSSRKVHEFTSAWICI